MAKSLIVFVLAVLATDSTLVAQVSFDRTFGGPGLDVGRSVRQTSDNGYVIVGSTESSGSGASDVWLIKTDAHGDTLWTKTFGGESGDDGRSVDQTLDGGYIIAGMTASFGAGSEDVYLIRTDPSGDTLWTRTFGGTGYEACYSVQQTSDGGYILGGGTESFGAGSSDLYLIKTNASGDTLWTRTYGDTLWDEAYSVQQTSGGGYIVLGNTYSFVGGGYGILLIKTDSSGNALWTKAYDTPSYGFGDGSVQQISDGGYILAGTSGRGGSERGVLIRTDPSGDTLWSKSWLGFAHSVRQTQDEGFIVTGIPLLIKTDSAGDTLWTRMYAGREGTSVQQTGDGGFVIAGWNFFSEDIVLIKTTAEGVVTVQELSSERLPTTFALLQNYPNPFNPATNIEFRIAKFGFVSLQIYNILGQEVATLANEEMKPGGYKVTWDAGGMASGVYFCRLEAGQFVDTKRLVVLR